VTDLEELLRVYAQRPQLDDQAVLVAREAFLRRIRPRRRLHLRLAVAVAIVVGGVAVAAVAVPRGKALTGRQIIEATRRALHPPANTMLHVIVVTRDGARRSVEEQWRAPHAPYELHVIIRGGFDDGETETSKCGTITYRSRLQMFTVDTGRLPDWALRDLIDPARAFSAYSTVLSRSETTFRGIPAYELHFGNGTDFLVRRDNFYPLRIASGSYVRTFSTFEQVPRSEPLLHVRARAAAFVIRTSAGRYLHRAGCVSFANYRSVTGVR
jgi:hypothetical protein